MRSIGRFLMKNSNDDGVREINYCTTRRSKGNDVWRGTCTTTKSFATWYRTYQIYRNVLRKWEGMIISFFRKNENKNFNRTTGQKSHR